MYEEDDDNYPTGPKAKKSSFTSDAGQVGKGKQTVGDNACSLLFGRCIKSCAETR